MKKRLSILFFLAATAFQSLTAQHFTLRVSGGYAWPGFIRTEQIMGPKIDPLTPEKDALVPMANLSYLNDSMKSYSPVRDSYGRGMNFTFAFGYSINPYIGVELGVTYLRSALISCNQTYQLIYQPSPGFFATSPYFIQAGMQTRAFSLSLMPSVIIQGAKPGWKVYPYGRLGISMPVFGGLKHKINIHVQDEVFTEAPSIVNVLSAAPYYLGNRTEVELETHGTVSLGVNGSIGVAYRPVPLINVFAEVNGQYLQTRAKSSKITKWEADGVDKVDARGKYRSEFVFHDKLDYTSNHEDYNANYDKNKPKDDIRPTGPFSNIGFNVGVTFFLSKEILGKKKEKKKK